MGKIDAETKEYVKRPEVFADLFNHLIYDGKDIIQPSDLTEMDTAEIAIPYDGSGAAYPSQKFRDVMKNTVIMEDEKAAYVLILGVENQTDVHYAMPVKNMVYDAYNYASQVTAAAKKHREAGDPATSAEYLSGMHKEDRLTPVITLVVYFGQVEWDGPMSIHEMLSVQKPEILQLAADYRINLIAPISMDPLEIQKFRSDFRELAAFIQCGKDKKAMMALIEEDENFHHMDPLTANIANAITGSGLKLIQNEKGSVDMCVAIAGIKEDGRIEGRAEGREEGRAEGRANGEAAVLTLIQKLFAAGRGADVQRLSEDREYCSKLMKEFGLS